MDVRELICIGCPMGCPLKIEIEEGKVRSISGNTCKKGDAYARKEVTSPTRTVTTTVRVQSGKQVVVPVKTKEDIPKDKIFACMEELRKVTVQAPVHIGDVIVEGVAGTGVPVVAIKNIF